MGVTYGSWVRGGGVIGEEFIEYSRDQRFVGCSEVYSMCVKVCDAPVDKVGVFRGGCAICQAVSEDCSDLGWCIEVDL